jgi:sortase B
MDKKKKQALIYNSVRYVAMAIAACTFTYASYSLTKTYLEYKEGDDVYEQVQNMFLEDVDSGETQEDGKEISVTDNEKKWVYDYDKLVAVNPDAKGYIKQDASRINYPILQGTDNTYYLNYTIDRTYNRNGSIFVDYALEDGLDSKNAVVYGHNMWTDSMFGTLVEYKDEEYCKENPTFDVYIGKRHYIYYVFASFECNAQGDQVYQYAFSPGDSFAQWAKTQRARSYYEVDSVPEITEDDYVLTLSTCTTRNDRSKRVIVMCVRGEQVIGD